MKLINFYNYKKLTSLLEKMGAELKTYHAPNDWQNIDEKLDELLKVGEVEIEVDKIDLNDSVFEYKGQKVIVYIRDQYDKYYSKGYKFHLTKCDTIKKAFETKRNSRYVISLRTDGYFRINLMDDGRIIEKDLIEPLKVCKNCLKQINYNGYESVNYADKKIIYENFSLSEYFEQFKSSNLNSSSFRSSENAPLNVYNINFKTTSQTIRQKRGYICSECNIDLSSKELRKFLHVHHINGDKSDDNPNNLQVLCIECHSNQPEHERLKHKLEYHQFLTLKKSRILNHNSNERESNINENDLVF